MNPTTFNTQLHLIFSATPRVEREDKLSHSNNYACTKSIKTGCVKLYTHIRGSHTGKLYFMTHDSKNVHVKCFGDSLVTA